MKKLIFLILLMVLVLACEKTSEPVDDKENEIKLPPGITEFTLFARETVIKVGNLTEITAIVSPPTLSLEYQWKASEGAIMGSGQTVYFSNCCASKPKINCTIIDKNGNKASKVIEITVID